MDLRPPPTVLQFLANLVSTNKEDRRRCFIINYYVEDREFAAFEKVVPNSGYQGGKFFKKCKANDPATGKPYEPKDIFIGQKVSINGYQFILQEASEATLRLMEARPDVFIKCDLNLIMNKLREVLKGKVTQILVDFQTLDKTKRQRIAFEDMIDILAKYGIIMGDQELLTVFRRYQFGGTDRFNYQDFIEALA